MISYISLSNILASLVVSTSFWLYNFACATTYCICIKPRCMHQIYLMPKVMSESHFWIPNVVWNISLLVPELLYSLSLVIYKFVVDLAHILMVNGIVSVKDKFVDYFVSILNWIHALSAGASMFVKLGY